MGVADTVEFAEFDSVVPGGRGGVKEVFGHQAGINFRDFGPVHAQHVEHIVAIFVEAGKRTDPAGDAGTGGV